MSRMIRVGVKGDGFVIMLLETGFPPRGIEISKEEASDLHGQLRGLAIDCMEICGGSDQIDEEKNG